MVSCYYTLGTRIQEIEQNWPFKVVIVGDVFIALVK